jgi:hypothetical protein
VFVFCFVSQWSSAGNVRLSFAQRGPTPIVPITPQLRAAMSHMTPGTQATSRLVAEVDADPALVAFLAEQLED